MYRHWRSSIVVLFGSVYCLGSPLAIAEPAVPRNLEELIARLQKEEARLGSLDFTVKTLRKYPPQPKAQGVLDEGPSLLDGSEETIRQVTQRNRLRATRSFVTVLTTGESFTTNSTVVFDGSATVAITDGNSAVLSERRYEPAWVVPPHSWGALGLGLSFPLSVYLQGTEALKAHPKVSHPPMERGTIYEFNKVEVDLMGEEQIDDLACVKLKVRRWYYTKSPPVIQQLWLAPERNFHVVRTETSREQKGKEIPSERTHVAKWRKLSENLWLPAIVESENLRSHDGKQDPVVHETRRLTLGSTKIDPDPSGEPFIFPEISDSLPKFVVGADGTLKDYPFRPRSVAADGAVTLAAILDRLTAEEQRFDRFEANYSEEYRMLNDAHSTSGGVYLAFTTRVRNAISGEQFRCQELQQVKMPNGDALHDHAHAYDGKRLRSSYHYDYGSVHPASRDYARFTLRGVQEVPLIRPHATVFRGDRNRQSLSAFLKSGWYDEHNRSAMSVEYVGDALVGDYHCHELKCSLAKNTAAPSSSFHLWLARDRNLISVRHEWRQPNHSAKLPASMAYVDDLREVQPGLWFPHHTAHLSFQTFGVQDFEENRLVLQLRRDLTTTAVIFDPKLEADIFSRIEVPEGTPVQVTDEHQVFLGQFVQPEAGNIDVGLEQLLQLRQAGSAKLNKPDINRRRAALDAFVGQPAPDLPSEGWLNTSPPAWENLAGKVAVVHFWATWWDGAEAELRQLADANVAWKESGAADRVAIGIHTAGTDRETILKHIAERKIGYPMLIDRVPQDSHRIWGELFEKFAVPQLPIAYVVGRDGKVAAHGTLAEMLAKADEVARASKEK